MIDLPTSRALKKLAPNLSIINQSTGQLGDFHLNSEQVEIVETFLREKRVIVSKSRQIGATTVCAFLLSVIAILNPGITCAIVLDTKIKAKEVLKKCGDFLEQIAPELVETRNNAEVSLKTKSKIIATTYLARGLSFQFLIVSELAYWPNAKENLTALLNTVSDNPLIIESTAAGSGNAFWELYNDPENNYGKVFLGVEQHSGYQLEEHQITDEEWERVKEEYGFKSRTHGAWWLQKLKDNGNDIVSHLRDYPVLPEHCWQRTERRWVQALPEVLQHTLLEDIKLFKEPEENHRYIAGVDTSGGLGKDSSCIVVLDNTTHELMATYYSNECKTDVLVHKMAQLFSHYRITNFVVESNGIGHSTLYRANEESLPVLKYVTTESNRYDNLLMVKRDIEGGVIIGCSELQHECNSLEYKNGRFVGAKDMLMSIGFALAHIRDNPYEIPKPVNPDRYDVYLAEKANTGGICNY